MLQHISRQTHSERLGLPLQPFQPVPILLVLQQRPHFRQDLGVVLVHPLALIGTQQRDVDKLAMLRALRSETSVTRETQNAQSAHHRDMLELQKSDVAEVVGRRGLLHDDDVLDADTEPAVRVVAGLCATV